MNIFFSVVIPLYNKERHIARAINSALINLESVSGEVIVVDDGSVDEGLGVVEKIAGNNDSVRYFSQTNQGVSAARNHGIKIARGNYIAFLDADDEWLPGILETISEIIISYPDAVGYGTAYALMNNEGRCQINFNHCPTNSAGGYIDDYFNSASYGYSPICSSTACISKKELIRVGMFVEGETHGEDKSLWARLAVNGRFAWSPEVLALRYLDANARSDETWKPGPEWSFLPIARKLLQGKAFPKQRKKYLREYIGFQLLQNSLKYLKAKKIFMFLYYSLVSLNLSRGRVIFPLMRKIKG